MRNHYSAFTFTAVMNMKCGVEKKKKVTNVATVHNFGVMATTLT
jgi:molybdopterin synthase catalytic subunit